MAVQKSRKSRAKRGMRRSHDALKGKELSMDPTTGEIHLRHHIAPDGFYKGEQILRVSETEEKTEEE